MIELIFTESYEKRARKFIVKHPELRDRYTKTLKLLQINPIHPALRLHPLSGQLHGLHSVSINYSYRIALKFIFKKGSILLIDVGSHDEVY